jgi:hypothetical protein
MSLVAALSWSATPGLTLAVPGVTTTVLTGIVTVTVVEPLFPSLVAVIVAVPAATAVARPVPETVATDGVPLLQAIVRPVSGFPPTSLVAAVSWNAPPGLTLTVPGVTTTVLTGIVTVTVVEPLFPSLVAVINADPGATAVNNPDCDTVATPAADVVQTTVRPKRLFPAVSDVLAMS